MVAKGRQYKLEECKRGHRYSETGRMADGSCRPCKTAREHARYLVKKGGADWTVRLTFDLDAVEVGRE